MKTCSECNIEKDLNSFYKLKHGLHGRGSMCKKCTSEKRKVYKKEKEEKIRQYKKRYYLKNKQKVNTHNKNYWKENKEKMNCFQKNYYRENKELYISYEAKRRAQKLNATLPGYNEEIKEIYKNCPKGHHVDHIYPLQGNNFNGLHVPWNLQYLPAEENLSKGNKSPEEWENVKK